MLEQERGALWKLWYRRPASVWEEALPIGNGRLGGMVYGGVSHELIALNEDTLWSGFPRDQVNYDALRHLEKARKLIFAGQYKQAEQLIDAKMLGSRTESYLPLGNLHIEHLNGETCCDYRRELDLDSGTAAVSYRLTDTSYSREAFVSAADQVMVVQMTAEGPLPMDLAVWLDSPLKHDCLSLEQEADGPRLTGLRLTGRAPSHIADNYRGDHPQSVLYEDGKGLVFEAQLRVQTDGVAAVQGGRLLISGARRTALLLAAATDFAGPDGLRSRTLSPQQRNAETLEAALQLGAQQLRRRHIAEHQAMFRRVELVLGAPDGLSDSNPLDNSNPSGDLEGRTAVDSSVLGDLEGRTTVDSSVLGDLEARAAGDSSGLGDLEARAAGDSSGLSDLQGRGTGDSNGLGDLQDVSSVNSNTVGSVTGNGVDESKRLNSEVEGSPAAKPEQPPAWKQAEHTPAKQSNGEGSRLLTLELPTDERLEAYRSGAGDPQLEALYFQYGRYLLMACSRPGTQAANLQGIWNPHIQPPWNSNYTANINTQMNYWPAEVCNLSECHEPLFDLIRETGATGARTARIHYGSRGWTAHHNIDLWRSSGPSDGEASWAFWPMGGVWLSRHLWEHYLFTLDETFLREQAFPLLKGAALFCLDWLVPGPDGLLVTAPSTSPENKFLTDEGEPCSVSAGSAMDMSLIDELFRHCLSAAAALNIAEQDWLLEVRAVLSRLSLPGIAPDGRLREWSRDFAESEPGHRHVSHLYGVYPGETITPMNAPELMKAARKSLDSRVEQGGGHTGWSCAWLINLYARLSDGNTAYRFVRTLLARSTYPNLFDAHPPFQIDGNFGGAAGIAEMLLQSHGGLLQLLPALPPEWPVGSFKGLKARGGFTVNLKWSAGQIASGSLTAARDMPCRLSAASPFRVVGPDGQTVVVAAAAGAAVSGAATAASSDAAAVDDTSALGAAAGSASADSAVPQPAFSAQFTARAGGIYEIIGVH